MAHTALYGGTVYEKYGGADLVGGTVYKKDYGKSVVGGTAYEVGFGVPCTVTIIALGMTPNGNANVTLNGQTYSAKDVAASPNNYTTIAELTVPSGTIMSCSACTSVGNSKGTIALNGTNVAEAASAGVTATYDYVVNGNIIVELNDANVVVSNMSVSRVLITEIPEGHALVTITKPSAGSNCGVTIDGIVYGGKGSTVSTTLTVPVGTVIYCTAYLNDNDVQGYVSVNGIQVASGGVRNYAYTVKENISISMSGNKDGGVVEITEQ